MSSPSTIQPDSLLIIGSGSVAACNLHGLASLLQIETKLPVRVVLTKAANRFVTEDMLRHAGGVELVITDETVTQTGQPNHIWLTNSSKAVLVYPASAGFIGKIANGLALDVASTTLIAAYGIPTLIVPSMNVRMWKNPLIQKNIKTITDAGMTILKTQDGLAPSVDEVVVRFLEILDAKENIHVI